MYKKTTRMYKKMAEICQRFARSDHTHVSCACTHLAQRFRPNVPLNLFVGESYSPDSSVLHCQAQSKETFTRIIHKQVVPCPVAILWPQHTWQLVPQAAQVLC